MNLEQCLVMLSDGNFAEGSPDFFHALHLSEEDKLEESEEQQPSNIVPLPDLGIEADELSYNLTSCIRHSSEERSLSPPQSILCEAPEEHKFQEYSYSKQSLDFNMFNTAVNKMDVDQDMNPQTNKALAQTSATDQELVLGLLSLSAATEPAAESTSSCTSQAATSTTDRCVMRRKSNKRTSSTNGGSYIRKTDKNSTEYKERRKKNNVAVRRSREKAKKITQERNELVDMLTSENNRLEAEVNQLKLEVKVLRSLISESVEPKQRKKDN